MTTNKNITHYQSNNETEAQDKFTAALFAQFEQQSGQKAPPKVDNSAWKPAQAEAPKPHFPFITVAFCVAMIGGVLWMVLR